MASVTALPSPLAPDTPPEDESLSQALGDVVDALGDTVHEKMQLAEDRIAQRVQRAVVRTSAALLVVVFATASWICAVLAAHHALRAVLPSAWTLLILAGAHAALAGVCGVIATRRKA